MSFSLKAEIVFVRLRRLSSVTKNTDSCSDVTILELFIHRSQQGPSPFLDPLRLPSRPDSQTPIAVRDMLAVDLPSSHSTVRHFMVFVMLRRLPARDGLAKMEGAKSEIVVHAPID